MKFIVILGLIFAVGHVAAEGQPCEKEKESVPWLETVEVECTPGEDFRYQCKTCKCDEDGKTASCPKWIKCCKLGEVWSTNNCNTCICTEEYRRICSVAPCRFGKG